MCTLLTKRESQIKLGVVCMACSALEHFDEASGMATSQLHTLAMAGGSHRLSHIRPKHDLSGELCALLLPLITITITFYFGALSSY